MNFFQDSFMLSMPLSRYLPIYRHGPSPSPYLFPNCDFYFLFSCCGRIHPRVRRLVSETAFPNFHSIKPCLLRASRRDCMSIYCRSISHFDGILFSTLFLKREVGYPRRLKIANDGTDEMPEVLV